MSQPTNWGVPRTDGGNEYTPEQFAERTDDSFDALLSLHKGPSRPSYAEAGTLWLDDNSTPWVLKIFDGSDDITIGTVNPSDNKFTLSGIGSAAMEDVSAFATAAQGAKADTALQPTITTTITFNLPLSASNKLMDLQQSYGIYSDNTGAGSDNTRLWLEGPDGGEVLVGPRAGAASLHQIRLRANTTRIEGNCVVTGSSLTINSSAAYHRGNILGTVSQSSGVPTGAIIERGSNANGEYVRYADGTQICTKKIVTNVAISTAWGELFQSGKISGGNFAAAFTQAPTISFNSHDNANNSIPLVEEGLTSSAAPDFFLIRATAGPQTNRTVSIIAVGRWF